MHVVIREFRHCFHDDREFLHTRNILDHVKLGPADGNVPEEMQKQVVSGAHTMNVSDRGVLCAGICGDHDMTFFFRRHELLCDVALNDFVREVPTQGIATKRLDLKTLLQCQTARLETDIHEPSPRKVGVGEYRNHQSKATQERLARQGLAGKVWLARLAAAETFDFLESSLACIASHQMHCLRYTATMLRHRLRWTRQPPLTAVRS